MTGYLQEAIHSNKQSITSTLLDILFFLKTKIKVPLVMTNLIQTTLELYFNGKLICSRTHFIWLFSQYVRRKTKVTIAYDIKPPYSFTQGNFQ